MSSVKLFIAHFEGRGDESKKEKIESDVNDALSKNPNATIEWMQSTGVSAAASGSQFMGAVKIEMKATTLTAIVTIP